MSRYIYDMYTRFIKKLDDFFLMYEGGEENTKKHFKI